MKRRYCYVPDAAGKLHRIARKVYRCQVRFFDDDPVNLRMVSRDPRVCACHVPVRPIVGLEDNYTEFVRLHGNWDPVEDKDLFDFLKYRRDMGHPDDVFGSVGLSLTQIMSICRSDDKTIVFDFDYVLNCLEGLMLVDQVPASGIAKYCVCTKHRWIALRMAISCALQKKTKVFIVTNNGGSGTAVFVNVCHAIHPHFTRDTVKSALPFGRDKLLCMYNTGVLTPLV